MTAVQTPKFLRMYFGLGVLKEEWKNGCRPVIGIDGCFLKGICNGVLLVAVGRDGNGQMYPIAWAVAESENGLESLGDGLFICCNLTWI